MGDPPQGTLTTTADRCANAFGRQLQRLVGQRATRLRGTLTCRRLSSVVEDFLTEVADWAVARTDILAVALVGSYARGAARRDSDVDLVALTTAPLEYTTDVEWARQFGSVASHEIEHWGRVTSLRVWYESSLEVEFGFATPEWASPPLDEGTRRVVAGDIRVLMDRAAVLAGLAEGQTG